MILIHATTIAIGTKAVILRGAPGSGKSDLALRIIEEKRCGLVADDQTEVYLRNGTVWARCPLALRGRIEVRGLGIVRVDPHAPSRVGLVVDLVQRQEVERMPEQAELQTKVLEQSLPCIKLDPFQASAPARIRAALRHFARSKS